MKRLLTTLLVPAGLVLAAVLVYFLAPRSAAPDEVPPVASVGQVLWPATQRAILTLEQDVRGGDADASTYARLGYAYLQRARETADGGSPERAERAFRRALAEEPRHVEALNGMGMIYLVRHQFQEALAWGRQAVAVNPNRAFSYGILIDAYIELGRYDAAIEAAQTMVNMRPDLASYSRVSYIRELMGDVDGAIEAMQRAVSASSGNIEHATWCRVYLGHLYFNRGDLEQAEMHYRIALQQYPYYGHALAGLGRVREAQGRREEAVSLLEEAVDVMPIGEYVAALGAAYEAAGQPARAAAERGRVIAMLEAERRSGMDVDEELAMQLLDRRDEVPRALALAEGAYQRRPTVKNADILAWAQYRAGQVQAAYRTMQEALRLGTQNARYYYHASLIAAGVGRREEAVRFMQEALAVNPYFAERDDARAKLASWRAAG